MPRVQLAGGVEVEVVGSLAGRVCECAFWFTVRTDRPPLPGEEVVAARIGNWWRDEVVPNLSSQYSFLRSTATRFVGRTPPTGTINYVGVVGGVGGRCCPANVAYRVNLVVATPPGGRRGCKFVPALPTFVVRAGRVELAWRQAILDAFASLIDLAALVSLRWVVPLRSRAGVPLVPAEVPRVVLIDVTNPRTAQRRARLNPDHLVFL